MEKIAPTEYPIHPLLARRWSPRAFAGRPVEPESLGRLFEAARWAPSSYNDQPWYFIVATKDQPEGFSRLLSCLVEGNAAWAKNAPVLMLSVARLKFGHNGAPNRHALHDVGQAASNMLLEATELGLVAHQMAGFSSEKAREAFQIPDGYEPVAVWAIGYPGDPENLPEEVRKRELGPRARKPMDSFVFSGRWGEPAPFVKR